jgi:SAM-dependent methyltransferase
LIYFSNLKAFQGAASLKGFFVWRDFGIFNETALPMRERYALMEKTLQTIWYEDDLFWETFGPELFSTERLQAASTEVDQVIELLKLEQESEILDLCCGIGRHSLALARKGFVVTGLDRTESYIVQARQQVNDEPLSVNFIIGDARRFCQLDSYDAVINMFTAFGYFEDQADDLRVLLNVHASLKRGGKLLIDIIGKEILARIYQAREWHESNNGIFLREAEVDCAWSWVKCRWLLIKDGKQYEHKFGHRLYSAVELSNLLYKAGFSQVEVYGSLDGAPYDHEAQRLVLVAVK